MLYNGEKIGDGSTPEVDIAVDPLEGTDLCAKGFPNSLAVIALADRGTMFDPGPVFYMEKMAGVEGDRPPARPRPSAHRDAPADRQGEGHSGRRRGGDHARPRAARRRGQGDPGGRAHVSGSSRTATWRPRSSRSPAARRWISSTASAGRPRGCSRHRRSSASGARSSAGCGRATTRSARRPSTRATTSTRSSTPNGSCPATNVFFSATGVTEGDMLAGVHFEGPEGATTESLVMRSRSGTVRKVHARHDRAKLREITGRASGLRPVAPSLRSISSAPRGAGREGARPPTAPDRASRGAQEGVGDDHVDPQLGDPVEVTSHP